MKHVIENFYDWGNDYFRELDAHALIGNLGGYVGLLLGFSILQLPDILRNLFKSMFRLCRGEANQMVSENSRDFIIMVGERVITHDVY